MKLYLVHETEWRSHDVVEKEFRNGEAVPSSSPTLPLRLRWVNDQPQQFNRNAVASIPDVALVPVDLMTPE